MKNSASLILRATALLATLLILVCATSFAQIKRTSYKSDKLDFGPGGTLSLKGAPNGSVRIEGWANNEIEIQAEIELHASTEADLDKLAEISGFILDESVGRVSIVTVGTHDKAYLKRVAKKFPKNLTGLPFKVNYSIKVPRYCDLDIDGGNGDLLISNVDGTMKVNFIESKAVFNLVGGSLLATFGVGSVELNVPAKNWRGRFTDVQLASGQLSIFLPTGLNAEVDAEILRTGKIDNSFSELKPKSRKDVFSEKNINGKTGAGGVSLKLTVGDGSIAIKETVNK